MILFEAIQEKEKRYNDNGDGANGKQFIMLINGGDWQ
jgi:hypothetical protein